MSPRTRKAERKARLRAARAERRAQRRELRRSVPLVAALFLLDLAEERKLTAALHHAIVLTQPPQPRGPE